MTRFLTLLVTCAAAAAQPPRLEPNLGWLNTDVPLRFDHELKGHVVLLDFWTHCCINCMHVLPDLEYLEAKYADEPFIVIGVHSAKFADEGIRESVRQAMLRYDVHHPVVVDDRMQIWRSYAVRAWPTFVLIGADGEVIGHASGEGNRDLLDTAIQRLLDDARDRGVLADDKLTINPGAVVESTSGLRFPGKVHAVAPTDDAPGRLFIADSSNDRVIIATWPDADARSRVLTIFGDNARGWRDGGPAGDDAPAAFHDPQGLAFDAPRNTLFVADTRNHAVRAIDLTTNSVRTIAGTGEQSYDRIGGRHGADQGLASPWSLELSRDGSILYVAMAGTHQLWRIELETARTLAIAGGRAEDIHDGPAFEALLAQPSGLALSPDGSSLYFADSEVSAIRALDLVGPVMERAVRTIIGLGLFEFGDVDGAQPDARLQHPLGVTLLDDALLIADTYNDKLKLISPEAKSSTTWLEAGFDEPGGLHAAGGFVFVADTNNHRIVRIDAATKEVVEVTLTGLRDAPVREDVVKAQVRAADNVTLDLLPLLPEGAHPNAEIPAAWRAVRLGDDATIAQGTVRTGALPIRAGLPRLDVGDEVLIELSMAYCFDDAGVCIPADVAWRIEVVAEGGDAVLTAPIR